MKLHIKNMVSHRCKLKVMEELDKLDIAYLTVELGLVDTMSDVSSEQQDILKVSLKESGLDLLEDRRSILVERVKNTITEMIHELEEIPNINYSDYISEKLSYDYTYLANVFSEVKGTTIQQYIITNKIERVKELLIYDELSLTEIAFRMHYSSVAHLSNQFKKVTGLTPSFYKAIAENKRGNLEDA